MSFYTSLSGLKNAQTDLNVIANNMANSETTGFKKSSVQFADLVAGSAYDSPQMTQGIGSAVDTIAQNFSNGSVNQTGGALDVAISGDGFFTMKSSITGQTLYTRDGAFQIDNNGYINDGGGNRLQVFAPGATSGNPADAKIPAANAAGAAFAGVTFGEDGTVSASYADGSVTKIGTVALAQFTSPGGLKQMGSSNWEATGLSGAAVYGAPDQGIYGGLVSGALEGSNVDVTSELVGMITAQRYFQANAKAIDTQGQLVDTIVNLRS
jgi:flagellar hook protein FlgE